LVTALLGDETEVHRPTAGLEDRLEAPVVAARVGLDQVDHESMAKQVRRDSLAEAR
jgi:hypothetical protein